MRVFFFFPSFSIDSSFTLVHRKSLEWIVVGLIAFSLLIHKFSSALPFFNGPGYTCHLLQNFLSHKARSHSTNLRWHPWIVPRGISSLYLHSATALQAPVNLMTVYCIFVVQSCPTLCSPKDCSTPSSLSSSISQSLFLPLLFFVCLVTFLS